MAFFEGGRGHPPLIGQSADQLPLWRWTACLDKSDTARDGTIEIDLATLSAPFVWQETSDGKTREERIDRIKVRYTYRSRLVKTTDNLVSADIGFTTKTSTPNATHSDIAGRLFDEDSSPQPRTFRRVTWYDVRSDQFYLLATLEPYYWDSSSGSAERVLKACAGRDSEPFLLRQDAL